MSNYSSADRIPYDLSDNRSDAERREQLSKTRPTRAKVARDGSLYLKVYLMAGLVLIILAKLLVPTLERFADAYVARITEADQ